MRTLTWVLMHSTIETILIICPLMVGPLIYNKNWDLQMVLEKLSDSVFHLDMENGPIVCFVNGIGPNWKERSNQKCVVNRELEMIKSAEDFREHPSNVRCQSDR
jgi:hypothetical protein